MKISLIHPSRGRAHKARQTACKWLNRAGTDNVEHIFSIDQDEYIGSYFSTSYEGTVLQNNNTSVVEATNIAAKAAQGDILIYLSDDFDCPENWGQLVLKEFENEDRPLLVKVDDCLQKFEVPVLTIPIMNRKLYEKLGYFWNPLYKSMFCDCDLYETVKRIGALKNAEHLKFPHLHHSIGKAENDATYKASEANWNQGLAVFNKRKAQKFPL